MRSSIQDAREGERSSISSFSFYYYNQIDLLPADEGDEDDQQQ